VVGRLPAPRGSGVRISTVPPARLPPDVADAAEMGLRRGRSSAPSLPVTMSRSISPLEFLSGVPADGAKVAAAKAFPSYERGKPYLLERDGVRCRARRVPRG